VWRGTQTKVDAPTKDDAVARRARVHARSTGHEPAGCALVELEDCCGPIMLAIKAGTESDIRVERAKYDRVPRCPPSVAARRRRQKNGTDGGQRSVDVADCVSAKCAFRVREHARMGNGNAESGSLRSSVGKTGRRRSWIVLATSLASAAASDAQPGMPSR